MILQDYGFAIKNSGKHKCGNGVHSAEDDRRNAKRRRERAKSNENVARRQTTKQLSNSNQNDDVVERREKLDFQDDRKKGHSDDLNNDYRKLQTRINRTTSNYTAEL